MLCEGAADLVGLFILFVRMRFSRGGVKGDVALLAFVVDSTLQEREMERGN